MTSIPVLFISACTGGAFGVGSVTVTPGEDSGSASTTSSCDPNANATTTSSSGDPNTNPVPDSGAKLIAFENASAVSFNLPIEIEARFNRIYVLEQGGVLNRVDDPNATTTNIALDISGNVTNGYDQGTLGFAIHPQFPAKPYLYVSYTSPPADPSYTFDCIISRFTSADNGLTFDPSTEKQLLTWRHPGPNHNDDSLVFGPDGYLYIGSGDGDDPTDLTYLHAQETTNLFGKILRIDVDNGDPYAIPPTNPYATATDGSLPEVYAYGFRNPWRFTFDSKSGRLWAGDVGNLKWEEVDNVTPGGNYGWGNREGFECNNGGATCDGTYIDPLVVEDHTQAGAIVGGPFYYGTGNPTLTGKYIFADAQSGTFWSMASDATTSPKVAMRLIPADQGPRPVSIRLDEKGEMLVAVYNQGRVVRVVPPTSSSPSPTNTGTSAGCADASTP